MAFDLGQSPGLSSKFLVFGGQPLDLTRGGFSGLFTAAQTTMVPNVDPQAVMAAIPNIDYTKQASPAFNFDVKEPV